MDTYCIRFDLKEIYFKVKKKFTKKKYLSFWGEPMHHNIQIDKIKWYL